MSSAISKSGCLTGCTLRKKICFYQIVIDSYENKHVVGLFIAIHVGLNDRVRSTFIPGNTIGKDVGGFTAEDKNLVPRDREISINGRQIYNIYHVQEVDYGVFAGALLDHELIGAIAPQKLIIPLAAGERVMPSPPSNVSSPLSPASVSLPSPPLRTSSPLPLASVSLPPKPCRLLVPFRPTRLSSSSVPLIVAAFDGGGETPTTFEIVTLSACVSLPPLLSDACTVTS